jgi:hypothetical protein
MDWLTSGKCAGAEGIPSSGGQDAQGSAYSHRDLRGGATSLPLASPAGATTPAVDSHVRGVTGSPAGVAGPAAGQAGIAWKRCEGMGKRFQCARVAVPLNWHRPAGTHIKLAVICYLGSDQKHRIGSMFVDSPQLSPGHHAPGSSTRSEHHPEHHAGRTRARHRWRRPRPLVMPDSRFLAVSLTPVPVLIRAAMCSPSGQREGRPPSESLP